MRKLTKLQYEVIFLYSKGLTFNEIDTTLRTASRGVYSQVIGKDKGRITRAKKSKERNVKSYKIELDKKIAEVKIHYRNARSYYNLTPTQYRIFLKNTALTFRENYINDSLNKASRSYSRYKITFLRNYLEKVA